jgi:uncharacterized protein
LDAPGSAVEESPATVLRLGRDEEGTFEVDANVVATGRTCVIGASGSGKSYAVGVICEELCKGGVPFAIVDTEGEYSGLKQKYDVIWVGDEEGCDLQWSGLDLERLGNQAPDLAPLVLDLSETEDPKQKASGLLSFIYREVERRRTPYLIIVEEADRFVPQNGEKVAIFGEIARRGRKRGVGLMVCTQRPSLVDKNVLSQCGNQLIGKLVIRNDLQAVAQFFQGREIPKQLTALPVGRFYAMGGLSSTPRLVSIKEKETAHGGTTPRLGVRVIKPFMAAGPSASQPAVKATTAPKQSLLGVNPTFSEEDVPDIVKRDKAFVFFGDEETVSGAQLVLRPMVELGVAVRTGILRKRVEMRYVVLDGMTGAFVEFRDVPVVYSGLERVVGLDAGDIEVLRQISADRAMGILEVANKVGVSRESLRRPLRLLEQRRLVTSSQVGRSRLYRRVCDIPEIQWHESEMLLEQFSAGGKAGENLLSEGKLREVLKGLVPGSEVQQYREFVYPLYRVELVRGRKKRIAWLDGRTGKELRP